MPADRGAWCFACPVAPVVCAPDVVAEMKLSTVQQLDRAVSFARALLTEGAIDWHCEPWREPRTLKQNAFLWRAVYQPLVERKGFTPEDWHEHFCGEYFGVTHHVKPSGESVTKPVRTTTRNEAGRKDVLKGKAFADFVTFAEAKCAEAGVFVAEEWQE